MTVVSRTTSRRTRRTRRTPRAGLGPTRRARPTKRYLPPALLMRPPATVRRPRAKTSYLLWLLMATDLATAIWMYTLGEWLDDASKLTATATLGGHHYIVLTTATIAFTTLAAVAILSDGFTRSTRPLTIAKTAACILSITALTGLTALILGSLLTRLLVGPLRP